MTKTTLPSRQVQVAVDSKISDRLNVESRNELHAEPNSEALLPIASLLDILKQRKEIRNNSEQTIQPIFTSFSQIKLNLAAEKPCIPEENEELIARRKFLKIRQEEREYNQMMFGDTKNPNTEDVLSKSSQFSSFRNQLSMGVNVLFSLLAAFGMIWYIAKNVMMFDESKSLIIGLFAAIVVLLVEMILYILRAVRVEDVTEKHASVRVELEAQQRSGGLVTAHFKQQTKNATKELKSQAIQKSKDE